MKIYLGLAISALTVIGSIYYSLNRPTLAPSFQCEDAIGCVTIPPNAPIKLVVLADIDNNISHMGHDQVRTIQMVLGKRQNRLLNHPVKVRYEDSMCSQAGGKITAQKVVLDPEVIAVLGTTCTASAIPASKILSKAGLVIISSTNTAPSLTGYDNQQGRNHQPGYFRTMPNATRSIQAAAEYVYRTLNIRKVASISSSDLLGQEISDIFTQEFEKLGGRRSLNAKISQNDRDLKPVLTAVQNSSAELLFLALYPRETILLVKQKEQMKEMDDVFVLDGGGNADLDTVIRAIKERGEGMYFLHNTFGLESADKSLLAEFKNIFGQSPDVRVFANSYDAVTLLLKAIEEIAVTKRDGTLHIGRQALRDQLHKTVDIKGKSGVLSCNQFGDCGKTHMTIFRLDKSKNGLDELRKIILYSSSPTTQ